MSDVDVFDLQRFITAQDPVFEMVLAELAAARKQTHWMWFVFPQLKALGRSSTARFYGIESIAEAQAYLAHPVLVERLIQATRTVYGTSGHSLEAIFGTPDHLKFHSCMTLFAVASQGAHADPRLQGDLGNPFVEALERWWDGHLDEPTMALLRGA